MKLICDANVGSRIARALADERVLITCDRDFGELVFQRGAAAPPAIIYVRFEPEDVLDVIPRIIPLLDFDRLKGHMTVVGDEYDRRTPFPQKS